MLFLFLLPLLVLFVPTNIPGVMVGFFIYVLICYGLKKYYEKHELNIWFQFRKLPVLILISIILGCMFYKRWLPSEKVMAIASLVHMQNDVFLVIVSVILSVLSVWSLNALLPAVAVWQKEESEYYRINCMGNENKRKCSYKIYVFLLLVAVLVITICSRSSFLYPFNDWVDSNIYFSIGKSMINGAVPYRDLFDHKGPIIYMLHALAAMISYDTFLGVYFIEIICCYLFLVLYYRIMQEYFESETVSMIVLTLMAVFIYTSKSFYYGDSAEELCMPLLVYGLWVSVRALRQNSLPSGKEGIWVGITSACVLWTKFTMLGFYIGWIIIPLYLALKQKQMKKFLILLGNIVLGICVVTLPLAVYFGINGAVGELLKVYFYDNLFSYTTTRSEVAFLGLFSNLLDGLLSFETVSGVMFAVAVIGFIWCAACESKIVLSHFVFTFAGTFVFIYIGGRYFEYYALILSVFCIWGIVWTERFVKQFLAL